ncbi:unnamed protein product [Lathyrus oleraceus]
MASSSSSSATILKFFFVFVVLAAMTSAQDLGLSPVSAPGPDAGAAGYITNSMAMVGVSIVLSMVAILKH